MHVFFCIFHDYTNLQKKYCWCDSSDKTPSPPQTPHYFMVSVPSPGFSMSWASQHLWPGKLPAKRDVYSTFQRILSLWIMLHFWSLQQLLTTCFWEQVAKKHSEQSSLPYDPEQWGCIHWYYHKPASLSVYVMTRKSLIWIHFYTWAHVHVHIGTITHTHTHTHSHTHTCIYECTHMGVHMHIHHRHLMKVLSLSLSLSHTHTHTHTHTLSLSLSLSLSHMCIYECT